LDLYNSFLRPVLFSLEPEKAHEIVLGFVSKAKFLYPVFNSLYSASADDPAQIGSVKFRNRLGLAAGFDKNGVAIEFWDALGFSHAEVGTVTPLPQPGNEKPRIFRLPEDSALINRMGFNNEGANAVRQNILKARKHASKDFVIGVNIGKNKSTPVEEAVSDYLQCFEKMFDVADYFTVNVSSPNTPGLRELQNEKLLDELLSSLSSLNKSFSSITGLPEKDIFLKIAPDLSDDSVNAIFDICVSNKLSAIIATNTTISRNGLKTANDEQGGLSGKPLLTVSNNILSKLNSLRSSSGKDAPQLVGVGGVFTKSDFLEKVNLGASLVQLYTGFIYEGPKIIKNILGR
jgi:dihydroorotate dehydrogenase